MRKRNSKLNHRHHYDLQFRAHQRMYYLFKVQEKRFAPKIIGKIQCAQHIQGKYRNMYLMHQQRNTLQNSHSDKIQDSGTLRALNTC